MSNPIKAACLIIVLALSLQACDININMSDAPTVPPIALTITAQAAILQQGAPQSVNPANDNPPVQGNQNLPSVTQTNTPAPENAAPIATNTLAQGGPVTVKVTAETNCRSGPGLIYNSIYSMSVSDVAEVIGKNTLTNYWIIKIPNSGGSICWLWGKYAVVDGNTAALVEYATPTPNTTATKVPVTVTLTTTLTKAVVVTKPNAPVLTSSTVACDDQLDGTFKYTVTVQWTDNSNNEDGFEISVDPAVNGGYGLGPNTSFFIHNAILPAGTSFTTIVRSHNPAGYSSSSQAAVVCP